MSQPKRIIRVKAVVAKETTPKPKTTLQTKPENTVTFEELRKRHKSAKRIRKKVSLRGAPKE